MTDTKPTLDEWRNLYQAAIRVKEATPWEWMGETDVFGVQNPETGEMGFVSIMGEFGEHFAVSVYLGNEGLHGFWDMQEMDEAMRVEALFQLPQLQASFENRDALDKEDHDIIKKLKLKFRGPQNWPLMRSYRPSHLPWYLEAPEVRYLTYVLEQTMDVAMRYQEDPGVLEVPDEESYLVRVSHVEESGLRWIDRIDAVPLDDAAEIFAPMDPEAVAKARQLPRSEQVIEMGFFMFPAHINEKGTRPYFPFMILLVDSENGMVLSAELMKPENNLKQILEKVPTALVDELIKAGSLPRQIRVQSLALADLLEPLEDALNLRIKATSVLHALNSAKEGIMQQFG